MIEFESGPPVGGAEQRLESARQVDEAVEHEKEHGQERRQNVHVAQQHTEFAQSFSFVCLFV